MTNDGWGKAKGWGKPVSFKEAVPASEEEIKHGKIWTTQQAVDKAVEKLKPDNLVETITVETQKPWPKAKGWEKGITEFKDLDSKQPWVTGLDLGSGDKTVNINELNFLLARDVKLNLNSKLFTIDAVQVGDLAIWDDGEFFAISHVPTLARFMNAVPTIDDKEYTNDQLVLWCTKVQRSHHEEWKILRALTPQNHSTKNTEAAEAALRLREWCLSVSIE